MELPANLLRCPACREGFLSVKGETVRCSRCGAAFPGGSEAPLTPAPRPETARHESESPFASGVIDLLPPATRQPGRAQRAMEWPPLARIYESRLWRRSPLVAAALGCTFEEERALVLRALRLREGARILDLACGPGIYTRPIASAVPGGVVLGVDISRPMLSEAAARARRESIGNIVWVRASASDIPVADGSLAGVSCCAALHLFPDASRALSEILRVLEPGGRFACGVARRVGGLLGDVEALATRWIGVAARGTDELRSLLEDAGFADVQVLHARRVWQIASAVRPPP